MSEARPMHVARPGVGDGGAGRGAPDGSVALHVAYVMSRFPKLTETFVLDEILELERRGAVVEVFPLWREPADVVHEEAKTVVDRAHFLPTFSRRILIDNGRILRRSPRRYLGTLWLMLRANARSLRFLLGALAIFPKACSAALRMQALGVTHVHAHFASHPAAAAFVMGRVSGIPWSFTAHGSDLHREQAMLREKVEEARFVVAISEYNRRFILDRAGADAEHKVQKVHCGIELAAFEPARSASEAFEIVCVGTLHPVKGQRYLIDACAGLRDRGQAFRLHLIGDGADRDELEALARQRGIGGDVVFHGACVRREVRDRLSGMHVAVAPSVPTADGRREGIPVALMEAAASRLPLVASRLSGIPELVVDEETGLLVEPGDVAGLESALLRLAGNAALRERLGGAARALVEKEFSLSGSVTRLEQLFSGGPVA